MKLRWMKRMLIYLVCLMLLTSCWNSRELTDLAIVTGIGIDKIPDTDEYRFTFQIVNPTATATNLTGGKNQPPITVYTTNNKTLFGALRKTSKKVARQLFFAHTQLLVIGESMAKSGINDMFDVFERSHELRLNTAVLVARSSEAASILSVLLPIESIPAMGIVKKTKNTAELWGENSDVNVFELIQGIVGVSDVAISGVQIQGDIEQGQKKTNLEQAKVKAIITISGIAVFKDGILKGWLDGSAARGTLWVKNKLKETIINIDSDKKKGVIAVDINYSKTKIKVEVRGGLPIFRVYIEEEGTINETNDFIDLSKREELYKLEKEIAQKTKDEVIQSVQTAQSMGSDIFNFGIELKRTNPKTWKAVEKDWRSLFSQGKLEVDVHAYILGTGMRLKPYQSNVEKQGSAGKEE